VQKAELRDSGAVLATALDETAELARDVHRAVAGRLFGLLGRVGAPVRAVHDSIAAVAYGSTRIGVKYLPNLAGQVAAAVREPSAESANDSPRGHFVLSALSGWAGDRFVAEEICLAPVMSVRTHGGRLRQRPVNVVHDLGGEATGRLVVFVHGLCENERFWWYGAERNYGDRDVTYGSRLRSDRGWTPLYLHYNTGLHVSENGRLVAGYLESLVQAWPVPVTEIALVGHSMGGLVVRSAAHQAKDRELAWTQPLRHIVGLGTPHTGAPLERATNAGMHLLATLPETRPFATYFNRRSVGIKDLRYGSVIEDDWRDFDPDERLVDRVSPASLLDGVAYSMASATLSKNPTGAFAHDLLVQHVSAHGTGPKRRIEFDVDRLFHLGGRTHFHLLDDPLIYEQLRSWLQGADGAAPPSAEDTV
jgi:pimeloyl-ACP methyl ester carboxylesterase